MIFSARPGRVKQSLPIELQRPRELRVKRDPRFIEYEDLIWTSIEQEVAARAAAGG